MDTYEITTNSYHGMITIVKPVHDSMIQIRIMQHI